MQNTENIPFHLRTFSIGDTQKGKALKMPVMYGDLKNAEQV